MLPNREKLMIGMAFAALLAVARVAAGSDYDADARAALALAKAKISISASQDATQSVAQTDPFNPTKSTCDCALTGVCTCGANCSCPNCPATTKAASTRPVEGCHGTGEITGASYTYRSGRWVADAPTYPASVQAPAYFQPQYFQQPMGGFNGGSFRGGCSGGG